MSVIKDFNPPAKVFYLHLCAKMKIPIGASLYDEIITEYPEYFPEEYEHKRKWKLIPQSVHDAYWKEREEFKKELWRNEPKSVGIFGMLHNTEEYQKFDEAYQRLKPIEKVKNKEIHIKHYAPYGIEPSDW